MKFLKLSLRRRLAIGGLVISLAALAFGAARHTGEDLDTTRYLSHIKFLASETMRGRAATL